MSKTNLRWDKMLLVLAFTLYGAHNVGDESYESFFAVTFLLFDVRSFIIHSAHLAPLTARTLTERAILTLLPGEVRSSELQAH